MWSFMKILTIHADFIEFQPLTKAIESAEETETGEAKKKRIEECLVVFTSVEKGDTPEVVEDATKEIVNIANQVKTVRIVIYPFVHLSANPAKPDLALKYLKEIEEGIKKFEGFEVVRAPFGWYKGFDIKCKGHPLAELSREFRPREKAVTGLIDKRRLPLTEQKDKYIVLTVNGEEFDPKDYNFKEGEDEFKILVDKEGLKIGLKTEDKEPEFIKICKKYGIAWEPMSDVGHQRFGPNGALIFDLVSDYSFSTLDSLKLPIMPVHGTNLFNLSEPAVKEHADLYGDRLYSMKIEDQEYVFRYAACHQQFAMIKDWVISYKQLPFGAFEIADSYRFEQRGETLLSFRLRRFYMPDMHVFCKNHNEAKKWFSKIHYKIYTECDELNRNYEMLFNFSSEDYYKKNKEWILSLLKKRDKPALLHFYPSGKNYYWTVNIEYCIIDDLKRPREIGTVQIDIGNAKRFNIIYTGEKGEKEYPVILHSAIIGGIERYMYMIFDTAIKAKRETGIIQIPLWLNPEQIRILPIAEKHLKKALKIANSLEKKKIRVGIDDRNETIGKKVRDAKIDWISYFIVIGDKELKELESEKFPIYVRENNKNIEMSVKELYKEIKTKTRGKPFRDLYVPREMSKRPII